MPATRKPRASDWTAAAPPLAYTTPQGLENLRFYAYTGEDLSVLAPLYQHWWRFAVECVPRWVAPNLITLVGFVLLLVSFGLEVWYCPTLGPECAAWTPSWVFFFHSFAVFAYQTLDAIDGKQARRTGSSSALGELFDHGCDAISTVSITLTTAAVLGLGTYWSLVLVVGACVAFYMSAQEHYHTGTLILGYANVTEVHCLLTLLFAATGVWGAAMWNAPVAVPAFLRGVAGTSTMPMWMPILVFNLVGVVVTCAGNLANIFVRAPTVSGAAAPMKIVGTLPFFVHVAAVLLWARNSPTNIAHTQPVWFLFAAGMICASLVGQLVVSRVTMQRITLAQPLSILFPIGAAIATFAPHAAIPYGLERVLIIAITTLSLLGYAHFAQHIIASFCKHLGIRAFHIKPSRA